jgi:hypothetical protein
MSADADEALWRACYRGDVSAVLHALGEHKLLRCVGGKEYGPAMSVGGTNEIKRGHGGYEKHQHVMHHGKEIPQIVETRLSESVLSCEESHQNNKIRTAVHTEHPVMSMQYQHLRHYNSRLAKNHNCTLLSAGRQPYRRWDELCYEADDISIEGRLTYTRNYVYPGKNGMTALHATKTTKIMELLLNCGWDPNYPDHDGNTAAHYHLGHKEIIEVTIEHGGEEVIQAIGPKEGEFQINCITGKHLQDQWDEGIRPCVTATAPWSDLSFTTKHLNDKNEHWTEKEHDSFMSFPLTSDHLEQHKRTALPLDYVDLTILNKGKEKNPIFGLCKLDIKYFTDARADSHDWQRIEADIVHENGHPAGYVVLKCRYVRADGAKVMLKPRAEGLTIPDCLVRYGINMKAKNYDGLNPKQYFDSLEEQEDMRESQQEWARQYRRWISNKKKYPEPEAPAYYRMDVPKKKKGLLCRK